MPTSRASKKSLALAVRDRIIPVTCSALCGSTKREKANSTHADFSSVNKAIIDDVLSSGSMPTHKMQRRFSRIPWTRWAGASGSRFTHARRCRSCSRADHHVSPQDGDRLRHSSLPQIRPLLERLCEGKTSGDLIFKLRDAKKALAGACRRLQLPPFSQRALRRMFITRAIERGVDVKVIAEWQGHKDGGKLILDTYSHVNRVHSQRMAQLMTDGVNRPT